MTCIELSGDVHTQPTGSSAPFARISENSY